MTRNSPLTRESVVPTAMTRAGRARLCLTIASVEPLPLGSGGAAAPLGTGAARPARAPDDGLDRADLEDGGTDKTGRVEHPPGSAAPRRRRAPGQRLHRATGSEVGITGMIRGEPRVMGWGGL